MSTALVIFIIWIGIGAGMTLTSQSRGWFSDALFVLTWPVHVVLYFLGKD